MTAQTTKQLVSIYTEIDIYLNSWAWGHFHLITINRQKLYNFNGQQSKLEKRNRH